uniref:Uncharacterized protein n=1 Tax=Cannabis sativa TaxID=3483 RepID=A0A803P9P3_CANSA
MAFNKGFLVLLLLPLVAATAHARVDLMGLFVNDHSDPFCPPPVIRERESVHQTAVKVAPVTGLVALVVGATIRLWDAQKSAPHLVSPPPKLHLRIFSLSRQAK